MNFELFAFVFGAVFTVLILAVGHWFPWRLTRIQAYCYGTASILAGFSIWRLLVGDWHTPAGLLLIAVLSGITVKLAYTTDHTIKRLQVADMYEKVDDAREK